MKTRREILCFAPFAFFTDPPPMIVIQFEKMTDSVEENGIKTVYSQIIFKDATCGEQSKYFRHGCDPEYIQEFFGIIDRNWLGGTLYIDHSFEKELKIYIKRGGFAGKKLIFTI